MTGWINSNGNYSDVCVFISKPNEFSESGSCVGANQTYLGSGSITRAIVQADLPSDISWEGSGNPLGNDSNVVTQGDSQSQVDETINSANETVQSMVDWSEWFGSGNMGWFSEEMISGVPNWVLAAGLGMFLFRDKLL